MCPRVPGGGRRHHDVRNDAPLAVRRCEDRLGVGVLGEGETGGGPIEDLVGTQVLNQEGRGLGVCVSHRFREMLLVHGAHAE